MRYEYKIEKYIFSNHNLVKIDSRDIKRGDIFLALKGSKKHGNEFVSHAIKKGAKYCISDQKFVTKNKKIIFVKNIFNFISLIAQKKRFKYKGNVIAITGSAGKTTLKETLSFFLLKKFKTSFSQKSYNNYLGVLLSILNLDLKSKYAVFELGTNNFGEIRILTKLVKPLEIFITNIQSTHLENFENKKNIAKEKSEIFFYKYNNLRKKIYLNIISESEKIILQKAKIQKNLKIVLVNNKSKKYFIKKIIDKNNYFEVYFSIKNKIIKIYTDNIIESRLNNLLFCYAFFVENKIDDKIISKFFNKLKPVDGRGLQHKICINNINVNVIDESYNANPDTMLQSVEYFSNLRLPPNKKILILGDMNELGKISYKMHIKLLNNIELYRFKLVLLCGEFLRRSVSKIKLQNNHYVYLENKIKMINFIKNNIHKNDIILIKCSNKTEVNSFTKKLLSMKVN